MPEVDELKQHYAAIRKRLEHPPNAVFDVGFDLKRRRIRIPPPEPIPETHIATLAGVVILIRELKRTPEKIPAKAAIRAVVRHFQVGVTDLRSPSRKLILSHPRQVAAYLMRTCCHMSLTQIGIKLCRDHSTILNAIHRVQVLMERDSAFLDHIKQMKHQIRTRHYG
jgi:hypothetical protein